MKSKGDYFERFDKKYYTTDSYEDYLERFEKEGKRYSYLLIKKLKPGKSWKFLDVGCGMAGIVSALRKKGFMARGTEVSRFCLENSPAKKWLVFGDILRLPFKDNSFETTIVVDTIVYFNKTKLKKGIKEIARITKKFIFLETICKNSPSANQKTNPDPLRKNSSLPTEKELIEILKKEGFSLLGPLFSKKEKVDFNNLFEKAK